MGIHGERRRSPRHEYSGQKGTTGVKAGYTPEKHVPPVFHDGRRCDAGPRVVRVVSMVWLFVLCHCSDIYIGVGGVNDASAGLMRWNIYGEHHQRVKTYWIFVMSM